MATKKSTTKSKKKIPTANHSSKTVSKKSPTKKPVKKRISKPRVARQSPQPPSQFRLVVLSKTFGQLFAVGSMVLLLLTVIFWSLLSARLQLMNADQLSDGYLFQNGTIFKAANFPGAHTFLLKWPMFYAMRLLGNTPFVFALMTMFLVLLTVGALLYVLHRIERRPLVFGCMCLALASILLLVPAQPYPGALLPVNMAMTTTRNIEYLVYIVALYMMLRATRLRSNLFSFGCVLMALLAASDALFVVLGVGGAALALCLQRFLQWRKDEDRPFIRWIIGSLFAALLARLILTALNNRGVTNIVSEGNLSPYGAVHSANQFAQAIIFGFGAFLTNLGANPIHGLLILREGPSLLAHSLLRPSIIAYLANAVLAGFGLWSAYRVLRVGKHDTWTRLSIALIWSSVAALIVFVATDHYYPVDARYLTIVLFALFVTTAVYVRSREFPPKTLFIIAIVLLCVMPFGIGTAWHEYGQSRQALSTQDSLTHKVADILQNDHITHLVGDYWSVLPVKAYSPQNFVVLPVTPCTQPRAVLTSNVLYQLHPNQPIAFLATRDGASPNSFVGCSLQKIHTVYGDPSSMHVVSGTAKDPEAILYIYSKGFGHVAKRTPVVTSVSTTPQTAQPLTAVPAAQCAGKTTVNVVAHEDDDLLFLNPDLINDVHAGRCVVTVYITTGDAGHGQAYWLSRQSGVEAAYSFMYAAPNTWREQYALLDGHLITTDTLASNNTMALVFLHLPDGGLRGAGFDQTGADSLNQLRQGSISSIGTEDGLSSYTLPDIINSLRTLFELEKPTVVRTQNYSDDLADGDHSDHHSAGYFAQQAFKDYDGTATIRAYAGYPIRNWPVNVHDSDATEKLLTFLVYAEHDPAVCQTIKMCDSSDTYGSYLTRQYSRVVATHQAAPAKK